MNAELDKADHEIEALQIILRALETLCDVHAQHRILQYAQQRCAQKYTPGEARQMSKAEIENCAKQQIFTGGFLGGVR